MPPKIRFLSENTINQIAAGEVIESPSSVIKELCENSLDAGAKKITVEIQAGGLNLLRVIDDGCGMDKDDAILCLERHATSKIHDAKDLFKISTMGFRGEAMASIASISRMTLTTSIHEIGSQLEVDAGIIKSLDPCPRNRGTTVEVRHLFFNVPARKKFQKSASGCSAEISRVITNLSLAHPDVEFVFFSNDNLSFHASSGKDLDFFASLKNRMMQVLGDSFSSSMIQVDQKSGPFTIKGFIGAPDNHRHNRTGQYLFINKRAVISPAISFAIKDGFGTRIGHDRHPVYVLHLEMPCELVDVNVHPQKKEVRLTDESWIKQVFLESIQNSFHKQVVDRPQISTAVFSDFSFSEKDFDAPYEHMNKKGSIQYEIRSPIEVKKEDSLQLLEKLQVIGIWNNFLMTEIQGLSERGLLHPSHAQEPAMALIDLKAAKSRCLFDKITKGGSDSCHMQGLFFPIPIDLAVHEVSVLEQMSPVLSQSGFNITQSGPKSFLIDAIPAFLKEDEAKDIVLNIVEDTISLDNDITESLEVKKKRRLAELVCRFVKSRKESILMTEAIKLVDELSKTSSPCFCPQGNKTIVLLSSKYVSSYFTGEKVRNNK